MKILLVTRVLYAKSAAEQVMQTLADSLLRLGHEVRYFALDAEGNPDRLPGAYVVRLPGTGEETRGHRRRRQNYDTDVAKEMKSMLERDMPDMAVVFRLDHLTTSVLQILSEYAVPTFRFLPDFYPVCPAGRFVSWKGQVCKRCADSGIRHCLFNRCVHGSIIDSWQTVRRLKWEYRHGMFDRVDGYIVSSPHQQKLLQDSGFTDKTVLNLELPLADGAFEPVKTKRGGYFLYVGGVEVRKGVKTLVTAMAECVHSEELMVVGNGTDFDDMRRQAEQLELADKVHFYGQLHSRGLHRLIAECTALVIPSECEEIAPWVLLQAQAIGKPAIVSDYGVLAERVTDEVDGFVFPAEKSLPLAQAMDAMHNLSDEEYDRMCDAAREHAKQRYHADSFAQRVVQLYDLAIEIRTGSAPYHDEQNDIM